jgi:hypothetical protein
MANADVPNGVNNVLDKKGSIEEFGFEWQDMLKVS